jgi:hypothetical protein
MNIEELKQALEAASPGPWERLQTGSVADPYAPLKVKPLMGIHTIATLPLDDAPVEDFNREQRANARLIAKAPTLIAELIERVERLQKVAEAAQDLLDNAEPKWGDKVVVHRSVIQALRKALEEFK